MAAFSEQPVRLFFEDEARFGLHLPRYRRLTSRGVRPKQPVAPLYEYYWLYAAVEPQTGEHLFWEMPALNAACFGVFLQQLARAYPESFNVVVLDGASAHTAGSLVVPENVMLLPLPAYSPELNPVERLWLALRQRIDVFDTLVRMQLDALREHVAGHVRALTEEQVRSLTGYGYIMSALNLAQ